VRVWVELLEGEAERKLTAVGVGVPRLGGVVKARALNELESVLSGLVNWSLECWLVMMMRLI
jgi:hypothetical protein